MFDSDFHVLKSQPILQQEGEHVRDWLNIPKDQEVLGWILSYIGVTPEEYWDLKHIRSPDQWDYNEWP
jgi:hypothetical protein